MCPVFLPSKSAAVTQDNGPRENQSREALAKLKPVFDRRTGTVTAGNASQVTDGAVALLVMSEGRAEELDLTPLGVLTGYAYAGCDPSRMGLGPAFAIARAQAQTGLSLADADLIELNEAFAAQTLAVLKAGSIRPIRPEISGPRKFAGRNPDGKTQRQRRRHRAGPSCRRDRRAHHLDQSAGTAASQSQARAGHFMRRRRPGRGALVGTELNLPMNTTLPLPPSTSESAARPNRNSMESSAAAPPATGQSQRTVTHLIRDDQVCVITFDRPGSAANIFDRHTLIELGEELEFIEAAPQIQGVILTSAKRSIFIAGADLNMMSEGASPQDVRELINLGQTVMNRLAALPMPTVAAIHGACVGGGYELSLACDYRVASTDRATKIGLPETMLGLLPAWGGSTRLPRLIGLVWGFGYYPRRKNSRSQASLQTRHGGRIGARRISSQCGREVISRGKPRRKGHRFVNNRLAASVIAAKARSQLLKKTRGHYPAVSKALEVATSGLSKSIPESLALERDGILELVQTEACHNLIRVFFLQERAKKQPLAGAAPAPSSPPITRAAVIGSGVMGAGIAQWLSARQDCRSFCETSTRSKSPRAWPPSPKFTATG